MVGLTVDQVAEATLDLLAQTLPSPRPVPETA
jgi:hypothetical protein